MNTINMDAFIQESPFMIKQMPRKLSSKKQLLTIAAKHLYSDKTFTEQEMNKHLSQVYHDPVELRRYLVDYGYLKRTYDCSSYQFSIIE